MHRNYHRRFSLSLSLQAAWVHEQDFEIYIYFILHYYGRREKRERWGTWHYRFQNKVICVNFLNLNTIVMKAGNRNR